jgi:hypothetical protein
MQYIEVVYGVDSAVAQDRVYWRAPLYTALKLWSPEEEGRGGVFLDKPNNCELLKKNSTALSWLANLC